MLDDRIGRQTERGFAMRELAMDEIREGRLTRPEDRIVAWAECGPMDGRPILRIPGTPGSRLAIRPDTSPWRERGLRMILTERPGFGASTRLPGRGFVEHTDDLAAILDELGQGGDVVRVQNPASSYGKQARSD